jgi:ferric-dicitrate binding protein FerR (iron transport regulator)
MSRVQKFGRKKGSEQDVSLDESAAALEAEWGLEPSGKEAKPLPPRRRTHPSNKQQMTRWFYRLLIVLFLALLVGLLWWGGRFEYGWNQSR